MINPKINVYIKNGILNAKERFDVYFSMKNSFGQLIQVAKFFLLHLELIKLSIELRMQNKLK